MVSIEAMAADKEVRWDVPSWGTDAISGKVRVDCFSVLPLDIYYSCHSESSFVGLHCCMGFSLAVVCHPFITVASCVTEIGSRVRGLQQLWHLGSVAATPELYRSGSVVRYMGLAALQRVGSSWTRDWTHVLALVGEFLTTVRLGKPPKYTFQWRILSA